jgi:perosamine synthetase
MPYYYENPPTAGLPLKWRDWWPTRQSLPETVSTQLHLPPLQVTCSGTAALIIALTALTQQQPQRKTVIVPAYTCPLVALAIHHCGLQIQLCDLKPNSIDLDTAQLITLLNEHVLAVIPTHLGGRVTDVAIVKQLVQPYQISVIEDAAQALGAEVGKHGDIVLFSLAAGKGLTMYEGGLLTAANAQLCSSLQTIANKLLPCQLRWELLRTLELLGYTALYNPTGLHFAYGHSRRKSLRKQQWIAAVGDDFDYAIPLHRVSRRRQNVAANALQRLPAFLHTLQQQAQQRIQQLQNISGIQVIVDQHGQGVWPFLMVLLPTSQCRDAVLDQLWTSPLGITRLFIHTLAQYDYLRPIVPAVSMPNAEDFAARMLTITNSPWLTDTQFFRICQVIQNTVC